MTDTLTRAGGCHCGDVRYRVAIDLDQVIRCNCSICSKQGYLLAFAPATDFELLSGEARLTDYRFNAGRIAHLFCGRCGVASFARGAMPDGTAMVAINVRCLDDVDLDAITPTDVDGRSR